MHEAFSRGPHPVGVMSYEASDPARAGRKVSLELWYPAEASICGQDLRESTQDHYALFGGLKEPQEAVRDAAAQKDLARPVVLFSHGFAGHRRQSTFLCTHLASHGFVVVSPDHSGNTMHDMMKLVMSLGPSQMPRDPEAMLGSFVFDRPRDMGLALDALTEDVPRACLGELSLSDGVGVVGHSFGGWTSLVLAGRDARIRALLPLAPAGGPGPLWALALERELSFAFGPLVDGRGFVRENAVETLYLAAARDSLLPLPGIEQLFRATPYPVRMFVLERADHMHFCDRVERSHEFFRTMPQFGPFAAIAQRLPPMAELVPGALAHRFVNGLTTLHMDAVLRGSAASRSFFEAAPVLALSELGIPAHAVPHEPQQVSRRRT